MGLFDYSKRSFLLLKNKKEIVDLINLVVSNIDTMYSEWGAIEGGIGNVSTLTIKIVDKYIFKIYSDEAFDGARLLAAFWYTYFYILILEEENLKGEFDSGKLFNDISEKVIDDILSNPYENLDKKSREYYSDKMKIYHRYYSNHIFSSRNLHYEMSSTLVNVLKNPNDNYEVKYADMLNMLNQILPYFKEKIILNEK